MKISNLLTDIRFMQQCNLKSLKQQLAELLEEDAKADKLRSLPLYSRRMTGWKFVCSKCYDMVYEQSQVC